jgi:small subunit ribosomal protein S6
MRRYETIVIINPDLAEDDQASLFNRIKEIIPQQEGVLIQEDLWGVRKLAYEVKKKPRGFYARMDYCGTGKVVDELERFFRIDDRVMKYLTVQLDPEADVEKIQAEIAAARAKAAEQASAVEESAQTEAGGETAAAEKAPEVAANPDEAPAAEKAPEVAANPEEAPPAAPETAADETTPEK